MFKSDNKSMEELKKELEELEIELRLLESQRALYAENLNGLEFRKLNFSDNYDLSSNICEVYRDFSNSELFNYGCFDYHIKSLKHKIKKIKRQIRDEESKIYIKQILQ